MIVKVVALNPIISNCTAPILKRNAYLGDSVGLVTLHNRSGQWAVGSVFCDNLSGGVLSTVLDSGGRGTSNDRENSSNGSETHFD